MRNGELIRDARVKNAIDPGISMSMSFLEWEAAHEAGLDLWEWEQNNYPKWFKAKVVAWYNLHNLVDVHRQSASAESLERKTRSR